MTRPLPSPSSKTVARPTVGVGVVVLRTSGGLTEVLLIRRGQPPKAGQWSIPGGKQELGETVLEAAAREALEETGVTIDDLRLIDVVDLMTRNAQGTVDAHWTLIDFCATWATGEVKAASDAADAKWVGLDDLGAYDLWDETLRIIRAGATMIAGSGMLRVGENPR